MLPLATSYSGFSGLVISAFSFITSAILSALAILIVTITNTIESIMRLIRIFIQYARSEVKLPVVRPTAGLFSLAIIICALSQLINKIQLYMASIIEGAFNETIPSALINIL